MSRFHIIQLVFVCFFWCGLLFPDAWWGTHSLAFLPPFFRYLFFISAGLILVGSFFRPFKLPRLRCTAILSGKYGQWSIILFTAAAMAALFYTFPIYFDVYGDAVRFMNGFGEKTVRLDPLYPDHLFSWNVFHPRNGERTVYGAIFFLSHRLNLTHAELFRLLGSGCGFLYAVLWLIFIKSFIRDNTVRILLGLAGLTAPFLLLFMGHIEIYAPSVVLVTAYFLNLFQYLATRKKRYLWIAPILLFFCLKFHSSAFLLVPSYLLLMLYHNFPDSPRVRSLFVWKKMLLWVMSPIYVAGAFIYFFVHGDHNDPRYFFTNFTIYDRMYLPIFSPEPPYDRYNLLSLNHIFDYFNAMLLWSPAALLFLAVLFFYRKQINWNAPIVMLSGMTLILYASLLFMVNPLLGMQFDWDLFSLPGPILLVFVVALFSQLKQTDLAQKLMGPTVALSLLTLPIFIVNATKEPLSYRLESLGIRTFQTYWIRSAAAIGFGIDMLAGDKDLYLERRLNAVKKLEKYAVSGNDSEFSDLLMNVGRFYLREEKQYEQAIRYCERAYSYDPNYHVTLIYLIESHFLLQQFKQAYGYSLKLLAVDDDQAHALRIAIHCALEAEKYEEAGLHSEEYLKQWPEDKLIKSVSNELGIGRDLGNIKRFFARGSNE